jgi:hypothetical protein
VASVYPRGRGWACGTCAGGREKARHFHSGNKMQSLQSHSAPLGTVDTTTACTPPPSRKHEPRHACDRQAVNSAHRGPSVELRARVARADTSSPASFCAWVCFLFCSLAQNTAIPTLSATTPHTPTIHHKSTLPNARLSYTRADVLPLELELL